jgi:hypothetical protein
MFKIKNSKRFVMPFGSFEFRICFVPRFAGFEIRISDLAMNLIELSTHLSKEAIQ